MEHDALPTSDQEFRDLVAGLARNQTRTERILEETAQLQKQSAQQVPADFQPRAF